MGVTANILYNEFIPSTFPCDDHMQFPYNFDEPLEVVVEVQLNVSSDFYTTLEFHSFMKGYSGTIDFMFPALQILRQVMPDQGGFVFWGGTDIIWDNDNTYWEYNEYTNGVQTVHNSGTTVPTNVISTFYYGGSLPDGTCTIFHCNIPIIYDLNDDLPYYAWNQYGARNPDCPYWWVGNGGVTPLTGFDASLIPNTGEDVEEIPREYIYISKGVKGTWNIFGEFEIDETVPALYKGFKIKYNNSDIGKLALYPVPYTEGDTDLKYNIIMSDSPVACYYTYDDGVTWQQMSTPVLPFQWIWRERVDEVGTFYSDYGGHGNYQTPVFADEQTARDYITGNGVSIKDAINYDKISGNYPLGNDTGLPEDATIFGECFTRNIFSQLYLCDVNALYDISNALFDYDVTTLSGLWADIKKGLEMYGSNPIEVVQGLRYYPFNLAEIFTSVQDQNYIYFGAYQLQLTNGSVKKIIYCNGSLDLGSMVLKRTFKDWRDFEPYTKLSIYLPYVGTFPLDAKKYYDKTTEVKYLIDLRTGACTACLVVDGVLTDWFDGIIGTDMPISLTDYSSYAQSQLNIIMRNAGLGVAGAGITGALGIKGAKAAIQNIENGNAAVAAEAKNPFSTTLAQQTSAQGMGAAAAGSLALGAGLMATVGVGMGMKTAFDVMQTGTAAHTKTKPASSAMINQYLPQYPYFRFEILEIDESEYLNELYGRPSNKSGLLGEFSGYLEAEDIMLICPIATDNERQEIIDLVRSGIYI